MGGYATAPIVARYLAVQPRGAILTLEQMTEGTGLKANQVQAVMYRTAKNEPDQVEVITRGHAWRLLTGTEPEPDPADAGPRFEVAESMGTALVLRDRDGALWLAKRIGRADA